MENKTLHKIATQARKDADRAEEISVALADILKNDEVPLNVRLTVLSSTEMGRYAEIELGKTFLASWLRLRDETLKRLREEQLTIWRRYNELVEEGEGNADPDA